MLDQQWVPTLDRQFRLQWEETQNNYVLLYPEGMVKLNGPAGEILSRCDGKKTVADIITELKTQFPDAGTIEEDVQLFMKEACQNKWLNNE